MVKKIIVKKHLSDEDMKKKEATFINDDGIKIYKESVDVYTDEGKLLVRFRKNVLTKKECETLLESKGAAGKTVRPNASGTPKGKNKYIKGRSKKTGKVVVYLSGQKTTKRDNSGIMGFYDSISYFGAVANRELNKNNKNKRCRLTAFTKKNMDKFKDCLPIFKKVSVMYKKLVPGKYKVQKEAISAINDDFVIKDTVFTTVTVNKNFRTALHQDSGDLRESMGNILVVSDRDDYKGAYTMFPQYKFGIDVRNGDLAFMDVHEWHCNSKMENPNEANRVSFVFYLREKMMRACPNMKKRSRSRSRSK